MSENKKNDIYKNLMIIIITALITCILTTITLYSSLNTGNSPKKNPTIFDSIGSFVYGIFNPKDSTSAKLESKITEINARLKQTYIGKIDEEKMMNGALEGYVSALGDEYTEYLSKEKVNDLMEEVDGSYVGIGVYITQLLQTNEILIIGVIKDSPADKNGLLAGDIIKKVDNEEYTGEQLNAASDKMRGEEGKDVKVGIIRNNEEKEFNITREKIEFKYVSSEMLNNNIGYIKVSSFEGNCARDFETQYRELESKGIKSLIIDLRNNGGGLVDQSIEMADLIVPKGSTILITKDKNNAEEKSKAKKDPIVNVPVVILINEYTASASEILTGALKDNVDAKLVGKTTYGKGVIQGIYLLNDNETALKVTIQEYFTPNGKKINKNGLTPDYEIELPDEWKGKTTVEKQYDTQLIKAIEILK